MGIGFICPNLPGQHASGAKIANDFVKDLEVKIR